MALPHGERSLGLANSLRKQLHHTKNTDTQKPVSYFRYEL